jgi:hypothetical protein
MNASLSDTGAISRESGGYRGGRSGGSVGEKTAAWAARVSNTGTIATLSHSGKTNRRNGGSGLGACLSSQ